MRCNVLGIGLKKTIKMQSLVQPEPSYSLNFKKGFPSISQEFLLNLFTRLKLPLDIVNIVNAMYYDCKCCIKLNRPPSMASAFTKWGQAGLSLVPHCSSSGLLISYFANSTVSFRLTPLSEPWPLMLAWFSPQKSIQQHSESA